MDKELIFYEKSKMILEIAADLYKEDRNKAVEYILDNFNKLKEEYETTKIICDVCGEEILRIKYEMILKGVEFSAMEYNLCPNCMTELLNWKNTPDKGYFNIKSREK